MVELMMALSNAAQTNVLGTQARAWPDLAPSNARLFEFLFKFTSKYIDFLGMAPVHASTKANTP